MVSVFKSQISPISVVDAQNDHTEAELSFITHSWMTVKWSWKQFKTCAIIYPYDQPTSLSS